MLTLEFVREFVYEHFPKVTTSKNGTHFHARCILCGDSKKSLSKKRFHLDWNNGDPVYQCFNCGNTGSFLKLYAIINVISISEAKRQLETFDPERIKKSLNGPIIRKKKESITVYFDDILKECVDKDGFADGLLASTHQRYLRSFIESRKIPSHIKLFAAYTGRYKGRIIIPVYKDDRIIYFQGRTITDQEPKYLNPVVEKSNVILNEEKFDRSKNIIITEGLLDAFMVGDQGTSALGASISEDFIKKLKTFTDIDIIIVMDNDERGKQEIWKLLEEPFANNLKFFIMPYKYSRIKDLNQLVTEKGIDDVYTFVVQNSYTKFQVEVMLKMKEDTYKK